MKSIGIYKIQSVYKPDRIYIGSSINIAKRWNLHLSLLRKNKHGNPKLQKHYNKYGESDLQFSIIEYCDKKETLIIEQKFLNLYRPYFNILIIAGSPLGHHWVWTEDSKKKFSEKRKGCIQTEEAKRKNKEAHIGQVQWNKGKKNCFNKECLKKKSEIMKEIWRLRKLLKEN